jgi:hypothetical protein
MENKIKIIRHGEVILKETFLPKEAKLVEETNKYIVAHSETGHHHILEVKDKLNLSKFKIYTLNSDRYIELPQIAELWHEKTGKDTHTPHKIQPAVYKIVIKKEFDYFAGAIRSVRD